MNYKYHSTLILNYLKLLKKFVISSCGLLVLILQISPAHGDGFGEFFSDLFSNDEDVSIQSLAVGTMVWPGYEPTVPVCFRWELLAC